MSPICTFMLLSLVGTSLAIKAGSEVTDIQYRPWQGSISKRFNFVCGCSLISQEWAVTAASCVQSPPYDVRFGSVKRTEGTVRTVEEIIVHENFSTSGSYKYNDIALLKFAPLELSFSMNSIKLGETEEAGNSHCHFTGWGQTDYIKDDYPLILYQKVAAVTPNYDCHSSWPSINGSHVCTTSGVPSTRQGDTGGALVCLKGDQYELVGISSWQHPTSTSRHSVYTRVSYFKLWIEEKTGVREI